VEDGKKKIQYQCGVNDSTGMEYRRSTTEVRQVSNSYLHSIFPLFFALPYPCKLCLRRSFMFAPPGHVGPQWANRAYIYETTRDSFLVSPTPKPKHSDLLLPHSRYYGRYGLSPSRPTEENPPSINIRRVCRIANSRYHKCHRGNVCSTEHLGEVWNL